MESLRPAGTPEEDGYQMARPLCHTPNIVFEKKETGFFYVHGFGCGRFLKANIDFNHIDMLSNKSRQVAASPCRFKKAHLFFMACRFAFLYHPPCSVPEECAEALVSLIDCLA
jgi:hypothetical protein